MMSALNLVWTLMLPLAVTLTLPLTLSLSLPLTLTLTFKRHRDPAPPRVPATLDREAVKR